MSLDFRHHAIAAHLAQQLAGPARAIAGIQELLVEQVEDLGLASLSDDLGRVGAAAGQLIDRIDRLLQGRAGYRPGSGLDAEAQLRHDLRTPLNAIAGYSEMLLEEAQDIGAKAVEDDIRAILSAAAELLALMDDIARFSNAEAGNARPGGDPGPGIDLTGLEKALMRHGPRHVAGRILVVDDIRGNRDLFK